MPTLEEWLLLGEDERGAIVLSWKAYSGEGEPLVTQILARFREEFAIHRELEIFGAGPLHGGAWAIGGTRPFIFDARLLPSTYLGVPLRVNVRPPLPSEFDDREPSAGYIWSPRNYEHFIDRCGKAVKQQLGRSDMTREEMLDALVGGSFVEHVSNCRRWVKEGVIPPFE